MKITRMILLVMLTNFTNAYADSSVQDENLTLTTFNTGLSSGHVDYYNERKHQIIEALNNLDSDFICLQELWSKKDIELFVDLTKDKFPFSYYHASLNPIKFKLGRNGLLMLSRYPLKNTSHEKLSSFFFQRSVLNATIETPEFGEKALACTHLSTSVGWMVPYLGKHKTWEGELNAQIQHLTAQNETDVLLGDMNTSIEGGDNIIDYTPGSYELFIDNGFSNPYIETGNIECTWCEGNTVSGEEEENFLLDHIFFRDGSFDNVEFNAKTTLSETFKADVKGEEMNLHLSDHFGVSVTLEKE